MAALSHLFLALQPGVGVGVGVGGPGLSELVLWRGES